MTNDLQTQNATLPANLSGLREPLPMPWINKLFSRMAAMYGAKFLDEWKGTDLEEVKAVWAEKLAGFYEMPGCIKAALDACDDRPWPPTLPEFLGLCRDAARRLGNQRLALEEPRMTKEEARIRLDEIMGIVKPKADEAVNG